MACFGLPPCRIALLKHEPRNRPQWAALLSNPNMRWLIAGFAALDYYEYIFFYWLYYYLGEVRKLSADDTAFYTTLPFLAWVRNDASRRLACRSTGSASRHQSRDCDGSRSVRC